MAVGNQAEKPRFFIDLLQYQYNIGNVAVSSKDWWNTPLQQNPNVISLNPTNSYSIVDVNSVDRYFKIGFKDAISIPSGVTMYVAILAHRCAWEGSRFLLESYEGDGYNYNGSAGDGNLGSQQEGTDVTELVNAGGGGSGYLDPSYNGWSLWTFTPQATDDISSYNLRFNGGVGSSSVMASIGSISIGFVYEPEFHADLDVTQRRIMDGVKHKKNKGGSTYSIVDYTKPPNWWTCSPFELSNQAIFRYKNSRIGRRSWDVKFSQLQDRFYTNGVPNGVFPANELSGNLEADLLNGGYTDGEDVTVTPNADGSTPATGTFNYNINTDHSLYSTVYHNTLNGTLPFLFSPSQDNSPGNFAICRFDKPGFQVQQKSYKKFNVKMRINESW